MESILTVTLPFFALVLAGYGAGRGNFLSDAGVGGLTRFAFYFALPAMLFVTLATSPVGSVLNGPFIGAYVAATLGLLIVWGILGRGIFRTSLAEAAVLGFAGAYGNIGFMAIPLLTAALGPEAAIPLSLMLTVDLVLIAPFALLLIEADESSEASWRHTREAIVRTLTRNPLVVSILAGVAFSATGFDLFGPIEAFARLLGSAAAPVAMFALGASLANRPVSENIPEVLFMSVGKLAVHPLAVWGAVVAVGGSALWLKAAVLGAAMPVATGLFLIAREYDVYPQRVSTAILLTTAVSMVTLSVLLAVF